MAGKPSVLFVCTGNTCRSPMAAAMLRAWAGEDGPEALSAGITAIDGLPASKAAVHVMQTVYGIDLSAHRAARLVPEMLSGASLIAAMTPAHRDWITARYPESAARVHVLTEFGPEAASGTGGIPDPFGGDIAGYTATARKMEPHIRALLAYILSTGSGKAV
jgi:protein-tyrosine-phosphatase